MNGLWKKISICAALATALCGGAFAGQLENDFQFQDGAAYIAVDTTREILTTLHSRLDAFRKVALPVGEVPAADTVANVIASDAYGSIVVPDSAAVQTVICDDRFLNRIWGGGLGTWQKADRRDAVAGYDFEGQGVILGIDRAAGAASFGFAASYVRGKYEDETALDSDSDIEQYSGHVYATYNNSRGFFFTLMGGYTYSNNDMNERLPNRIHVTNFRSHTFNAGARMGFDFEPSATVVITPSVGANFFHSKSLDHNVARVNPLNNDVNVFRYNETKHNMVEIPFDITVAKEISFGDNRMLQLSANGGYAYNLNDKGIISDVNNVGTPGTIVSHTGRRLGHHALKAGVGARLKMDLWDIGVKYDFLARSDYKAHRVMGTVGYSF